MTSPEPRPAASTPGTPVLSVVIPAHNEQAVIAANLRAVLVDARPGEFDVVVVVNGSTDRTAELARAAGDAGNEVRVVEIQEASKVAALNAGDAATDVFPRVYLDADVTTDAATLRALARALDDSTPYAIASPSLIVDTRSASRAVRSYYRVWNLTDYRQRGHIGSGIYALSRDGRARFGAFPDLIADDTYVQQLFALEERTTLPDFSFTVRSPATLRAMVHRSARIAAGNSELKEYFARTGTSSAGEDWGGSSQIRNLVLRVARSPRYWADFPVYCVGYVASRLAGNRKRRRGSMRVWERDETSRA
ncbi:glycosyltransferase [Planctomonas psychrotolerans]|uniref:glycosyltransferase n=1 Tax=Planctomonas psychrotolerans TaxID=2528712 RepID=UPI0012395C85|nr:glycosyltransferase [Planctomonas psychrotolerans]